MIEHILVNESNDIYTLTINNKIIKLRPNKELPIKAEDVKKILKIIQNTKGLKITCKNFGEVKETKKSKRK